MVVGLAHLITLRTQATFLWTFLAACNSGSSQQHAPFIDLGEDDPGWGGAGQPRPERQPDAATSTEEGSANTGDAEATASDTTESDTSSDVSTSGVGKSVVVELREALDLVALADATTSFSVQATRLTGAGAPYSDTYVGSFPLEISDDGDWYRFEVIQDNSDPPKTWLPTIAWFDKPTLVPVFSVEQWTLQASEFEPNFVLGLDRGHVVVQVLGDLGPLSGVTATAGGGTVAYGSAGHITSALAQTDDSGLVVWLNAPAGAESVLGIQYGGNDGGLHIQVQAGAISVLQLQF